MLDGKARLFTFAVDVSGLKQLWKAGETRLFGMRPAPLIKMCGTLLGS